MNLLTELRHYWNLDDEGIWADSLGTANLVGKNAPTVANIIDFGPMVSFVSASSQALYDPNANGEQWRASPVTITGWAKGNNASILCKRSNSLGQDFQMSRTFDSDSGGYNSLGSYTGTALRFCVATWDTSNNGYKTMEVWEPSTGLYYVSTIARVGFAGTSARPYAIGTDYSAVAGWPVGVNNAPTGQVARVGIWSRILSDDEKLWLYNAGYGRYYADLLKNDVNIGSGGAPTKSPRFDGNPFAGVS